MTKCKPCDNCGTCAHLTKEKLCDINKRDLTTQSYSICSEWKTNKNEVNKNAKN